MLGVKRRKFLERLRPEHGPMSEFGISWHALQISAATSSKEASLISPAQKQRQSIKGRSNTSANMGRMHSNGKGISASAIPYSRSPPSWLKTTPDAVVDQICKLAKKGATPSQIGVVLRDSHGIAQVKIVTGITLKSRENE